MRVNQSGAQGNCSRGTQSLTAFVSILGMLTNACTMSVPELKVRPASSYAITVEKDGLRIGIHTTVDAREMEDAFRINLLEKGLLPVLLVVENHSTATSFILAREHLTVTTQGMRDAEEGGRPPVTSTTAAGVIGGVGAATLALPLLIVGMKMRSDAKIIEYNLSDKAFYSRTIDPGKSASGYVYVNLPKEPRSGGRYELTLRAVDASGGRATTVSVPIEYFPR